MGRDPRLGHGHDGLAAGRDGRDPWSFERKGLVMGLLAGSSATGQLAILPLTTWLIETMVGALRWRHQAATVCGHTSL